MQHLTIHGNVFFNILYYIFQFIAIYFCFIRFQAQVFMNSRFSNVNDVFMTLTPVLILLMKAWPSGSNQQSANTFWFKTQQTGESLQTLWRFSSGINNWMNLLLWAGSQKSLKEKGIKLRGKLKSNDWFNPRQLTALTPPINFTGLRLFWISTLNSSTVTLSSVVSIIFFTSYPPERSDPVSFPPVCHSLLSTYCVHTLCQHCVHSLCSYNKSIHLVYTIWQHTLFLQCVHTLSPYTVPKLSCSM